MNRWIGRGVCVFPRDRDIVVARRHHVKHKFVRCHNYPSNLGTQVFGGYGYSMEFDMRRHYRDARSTTIAAGTSQIQRNIVAGPMGLKVQQQAART